MLHPTKWYVVLKAITQNEIFFFKRSTACLYLLRSCADVDMDNVLPALIDCLYVHWKFYDNITMGKEQSEL